MINAKKKKIVLASGTFDLLHLGHVKYLEEAKKKGGQHTELIVIVARDKTIEKQKGGKPVIPENQRRVLVESLKVVDKAILGYEKADIKKTINKIQPDVIAIGYDQNSLEKTIKNYVKQKGLNIKVIKIGKFGEGELDSSSKIKQEIIENFKR